MSEKASMVDGFSQLSSEQVVNALAGITPPVVAPPAATTPPAQPPAAPVTPAAEDPKDKQATPPAAAATPAADKKEEGDKAAPAAEKDKDAADKDKAAVPADDKKDKDKADPKAAEAGKDADSDKDKDKAPVVPEFDIPGADKDGKEIAAESEGWAELAKEIGFEIKEDKFEEFKENLENYYKKKHEPNLGKYNAETQALFEFLEAGGTVEQYVKPTETFDRLMALEDKALVVAELKARGDDWTDDKVAREVQRLEEVNQLDLLATHVRERLSSKKLEVQKNIVDLKKNAATRQNTYQSKISAEHTTAIKNSLNIVSDFMGTPLGAKQKDYITSKVQKGEYANILSDPKEIAEFLLWKEFGKQAITNLKNKSYNEGVDKYKNDRHNIPPKQEAGNAGAKGSTQAARTEDNKWAALENWEPSMLGKF